MRAALRIAIGRTGADAILVDAILVDPDVPEMGPFDALGLASRETPRRRQSRPSG